MGITLLPLAGIAFGLAVLAGILAGPLLDLCWLIRERWRRLVAGLLCEARVRPLSTGSLHEKAKLLAASVRQDLSSLSLELARLSDRLVALENEAVEAEENESAASFELVSEQGSRLGSRPVPTTAYPLSPGSSAGVSAQTAAEQTWAEREDISREVGRFLRRSLNGSYRGKSGRHRIRLPRL